MAAVCSLSANALVLGDIQVNSSLGQPLNAKIVFADLNNVDTSQLTVRLAGVEDYKKLGLQYPESIKFNFQLVNEPGRAYLRITTLYPLDDPFVNLLLEFASPDSKLFKSYTFLLDPSPDFYQSPADEISRVNALPAPISENKSAPVQTAARRDDRPAVSKPKRKAHHMIVATEPAHVHSDGMHMKLSMSLSISSEDVSAGASVDALQEELIAKEKSLEDLKLQVGEMQSVIESLRSQQVLPVVSAASAAPDVIPTVSAPVAPVSAPVVITAAPVAKAGKSELNAALAFAALVLGVAFFVGYQKYKRMHAEQQGPFDDLYEEEIAAVQEGAGDVYIKPEAPPVTMMFSGDEAPFRSGNEQSEVQPVLLLPTPIPFEKVEIGEPSMQIPAYTSNTVPPEYVLLMEAKRHLRAGNNELAEAALIKAIEINPKNIFGYQALLRIYEASADIMRFEEIILRLKQTGDESAFKEAAEIGHKLDPDNPLYL